VNIHEHQGKELFRQYKIPVPLGKAVYSVEEALKAAPEVSPKGPWVVKAQIHAGGRGKGGGVKVAKTLDEVKQYASKILGMTLVTHQTGPTGRLVRRLLIEEGANIKKEYYLSVTLDRNTSSLAIMASTEGGMDIEEVAASHPEKIFKEWVDPSAGLGDFQCRRLSKKMGFAGPSAKQFSDILRKLVRFFQEQDCAMAEINPLILTGEGNLVALDAKIGFDDNAGFRHPEWAQLNDPTEEDPSETRAKKHELSYISLDGNIGCMVNGAGLAMSTMDIIKLEGGSPANFLDVGGGATEARVKEAFKIILSDEKVKAILVNIFGGIMKCDVIATGVIGAARELQMKVPLVVRLEGTNVELGKKLLSESGLKITPATGMKEAAQKVVAAAGGKS
jgi:succinyl-CoA synthetase beta subunit